MYQALQQGIQALLLNLRDRTKKYIINAHIDSVVSTSFLGTIGIRQIRRSWKESYPFQDMCTGAFHQTHSGAARGICSPFLRVFVWDIVASFIRTTLAVRGWRT